MEPTINKTITVQFKVPDCIDTGSNYLIFKAAYVEDIQNFLQQALANLTRKLEYFTV